MSIRVPKGRQPVLAPAYKIQEIKALGAEWHKDIRLWSVPVADAHKVPQMLLPLRDRPQIQSPYIKINLIPQTSWGRNIRALIPKEEWRSFAKKYVYSMTGHACLVCGGRGEEWPVEADEVWHFDDKTNVQRLNTIVPLCPSCHEIRSAGLSISKGIKSQIIGHLSWVNRCTRREAEKQIDKAMDVWQQRCRKKWKLDISLMEQKYGISLQHDDAKTSEINAKLVAEALAKKGKALTL